MWRNVPNVLSLSRIPLAAAFLLLYDLRSAAAFWTGIAVLGIAFLTDLLDGRLARAWDQASITGYLLDGLGDKVFYAALLLAIAREYPSQDFLAWSLIARELVWYGVRAAAPRPQEILKFLRSFSVAYALMIRLYFGGFFTVSWFVVHFRDVPSLLSYYPLLGVLAAVIGWMQIIALWRVVTIELRGGQSDRR